MSDRYTMLCPTCGGLPVDSAELATLKMERNEAAMRSLSAYASEMRAVESLATSTALSSTQAARIVELERLLNRAATCLEAKSDASARREWAADIRVEAESGPILGAVKGTP